MEFYVQSRKTRLAKTEIQRFGIKQVLNCKCTFSMAIDNPEKLFYALTNHMPYNEKTILFDIQELKLNKIVEDSSVWCSFIIFDHPLHKLLYLLDMQRAFSSEVIETIGN
jgi:hypothetical protein